VHEQGLRRTGHAGDQTMAAHVERDQQVVDNILLANNGAGYLFPDIGVGGLESFDQLPGFFSVKGIGDFTHSAFLFTCIVDSIL